MNRLRDRRRLRYSDILNRPDRLAESATVTAENLAALTVDGFVVRNGTDWITRVLEASGDGLELDHGDGIDGNPTLTLANDLAAIEDISGFGLAVRKGVDSWIARELAGTPDRITITNPGGVAGNPTVDIAATYAGQASITTLGTVTAGVWNATTVAAGFGGTGITSYALGDTLYASSASTLAKLAGNTTTTRKFMRQTGNGAVSAAPAWDTFVLGDIPDLSSLYQPLDGDLTSLAALTGTGYGKRTGVNTWALGATVPWTDVSSTPTTLAGYGITDAQPLDADLTAIAAIATTAYGRSFLALAAAVDARNLVGLGTTDSPAFLALTTDADFYFGSANSGSFSDFSGEPSVTRSQPWFRRNGQNGNFAIQNTHTSYYSGFRFIDSAGNERGAMAWGNSASASPFTSKLFIEYSAPASLGTVADFLIVRTLIGSPHEEVARFTNAKNLLIGTTDETGLLAGGGNLKCANVREKLRSVRTYYVRTDGSDSNTGLVDTAGGAFLTIQAAINAVAQIDTAIYAVTIQVRDGTYTVGALVSLPFVGAGSVTLQGNTATPSNCVISVTSGHCLRVLSGSVITVNGFKLATTTSGFGVISSSNASVTMGANMELAACASGHLRAVLGGVIVCQGNYTINGSSPIHWDAESGGQILSGGNTITLTGTPAFSTAFAYAVISGDIQASSITFSGGATGTRYNVATNGVINTGGGGASYLPGDAAGTSATGGQYA